MSLPEFKSWMVVAGEESGVVVTDELGWIYHAPEPWREAAMGKLDDLVRRLGSGTLVTPLVLDANANSPKD